MKEGKNLGREMFRKLRNATYKVCKGEEKEQVKWTVELFLLETQL